jgi:hypothetical protein
MANPNASNVPILTIESTLGQFQRVKEAVTAKIVAGMGQALYSKQHVPTITDTKLSFQIFFFFVFW